MDSSLFALPPAPVFLYHCILSYVFSPTFVPPIIRCTSHPSSRFPTHHEAKHCYVSHVALVLGEENISLQHETANDHQIQPVSILSCHFTPLSRTTLVSFVLSIP